MSLYGHTYLANKADSDSDVARCTPDKDMLWSQWKAQNFQILTSLLQLALLTPDYGQG